MPRTIALPYLAGPPRKYRSIATGGCPNMSEEFVARRRLRPAAMNLRGRAPRVEVGSPDMRCLFGSQTRYYTPTLGGAPMQREGGNTKCSMDNIREIAEELGAPLYVRSHEGRQFRWQFPGSEWYVALGFGLGYTGEGPAGLAELLVEFDTEPYVDILTATRQMRRFIRGLPRDFTGVVRRWLGRHDSQPTKKTWIVGANVGEFGSNA